MPTVISAFAGCGGSSLGYQMAGYKELLAIEWDNNAVETFSINFPDIPIYHGDIAKLSSEECMKLANIRKGELDILDGSPPCQGFTTYGKRRLNDPRNYLFKEYARLLRDLQPKVFIMENVIGMIRGHMKQIYLQIINTFRECGYRAKGEVMNAKYFNVPQSRERVIIIGVREDLGIEPTHPKPQSKPITVKEAFKNIDNKTFGKDTKGYPQERIYPLFKQGQNGLRKIYPLFKKGQKSLNGKFFKTRRLAWNKPAPTICKTTTWTGFSQTIHPDEDRDLTIEEAKRLSSFPDNFKFVGTYSEQWARIGNSVPPNLMKAIAEHIKINILEKVEL